MSYINNETEELAEENGFCIQDENGHIRVYDMEANMEPVVAWYYNGGFQEAINEDLAEALPMKVDTPCEYREILHVIINELR